MPSTALSRPLSRELRGLPAMAMIALLMLALIQPLTLAARAPGFRATAAVPSLVAQLQTTFPTLAPDLATRGTFVAAQRVIAGRAVAGLELERRAARTGAGLDLFFPARYNDTFVIVSKGIQVRMRALDAQPAPAQIEDGTLAYRNAYRATDSVQLAGAEQSKEFLLLHSAAAPTRFRYALDVGTSTAVTLDQGVVRIADAQGHLLRIPAPWLVDASGLRNEIAAHWELGAATGGARLLTLALDPRGLAYPLALDPSWSTASSMSTARYAHTATLLPNGKVLMAGGYSGSVYLASAELYDPASNTWSPAASMSNTRYAHTATLLLNGKVLVTGGYGSNFASAELYDPASNTWSAAASMTATRFAHTATLLPNGTVLVAGGHNNGSAVLASAELYDPASNTWSAAASMTAARFAQTATLLPNGKVLMAGGYNGSVYLPSAELYDPASNTWSAAGSMAGARYYHTATLLPNGKVLVAGGYNGSVYLTSAELYDPASNTWSAAGSMAGGRFAHTATLLPNGTVLVGGGYDGSYLASAELYDPASNTWSAAGSMAGAHYVYTATLLPNSTVLLAGGYNGSYLASAELYTALANTPPTASAGSLTTNEDTTASSALSATDVDGDGLTYSIVTNGAQGVATITNVATGAYTYTPNANANGSDSFTFKVNDGTADSNVATVSVTITPVNDPPVATNGSLTTNEDTAGSGTLIATDVEANPLTYSIVANGAKGVATITNAATGAYSYAPNANANGSDSFTFQASDDTALAFDGVNDYAIAPLNGTALTQVTVEMWLKPTASASKGIFQWGNTIGSCCPFIYFFQNGTTFTLYMDNGYRLNTALPLNQWTHLATTYDGTSWQLYKNGVLAGTYTGGTTFKPNAASLYFGNGFNGYFGGQIDEARVWNVARTQVQLQGAMNTPLVGNETGLISYHRFNDGIGSSTAINAVSGGPAATLTNMNAATAWVNSPFGATSNVATVNVTITPVNDAPAFTKGANQTVLEDASAQSVTSWATAISAGPADESGQTINFLVSNTNNALFTVQPAIAANGALTYTPVANANGSATVSVQAHDTGGTANSGVDTSVAQTFTITITPVNDVPAFTKGADQTVLEDAGAQSVPTWATAISAGPTDESGQTLNFLVSNNNNALFTAQPAIAANGTLTYTPAANANGSATVSVQAHDTGGTANGGVDTSVAQTFTITITPVNDAPVASVGSLTTNEDTTVSSALAATDVDANPLIYSIVVNGAQGVATITNAATGAYTYTPNANANGSDSFTFKVNDGTVDSNVATVSITITPVNDVPAAADDTASVAEDGTLNVAAPGVLANDSDVDTDPLAVQIVGATSNGALMLNADGSFDYTPSANFCGADSFTYQATDGALNSATATVAITVTCVNDAPTISDIIDTSTNEDIATGAIDFTIGDLETAVGSLTVSGSSSNQTLVPDANIVFGGSGANRTVTITPAANQHGTATITVQVSDGTASASDTFVLTVNAVNDAPVAADDVASVAEDGSLTVAAPGVLANDSDVDGDALTVQLVSGPSHGALTLNADGAFSYTPSADYCGADSFQYQATDGTLNSASATVAITFTCANDVPVASAGNLTTNEDTAATGTLTAADIDNDPLTYSIVVNGTQGVATITNAATGAFIYTPNANANGTDSFTFKVNDGTIDSNIATVSVTITPVNDAPVATDDILTTNEDTAGSGTLAATDADGTPVTYSIVANGAKGVATLTNAATGTYSYTPNADANGSDSFTFNANDGTVDSNVVTVNITITPVNDAPTLDALADVSVVESAPTQTIGLTGISAGPADESGQTLTVTATSSNPALIPNPSVTYTSPNATGTLSFAPVATVNGSATISVIVTDNGSGVAPNANSFTRTFVVFVGAVNNRPTLDQPADLITVEDSGAQTVNLTGISAGPADERGQSLTVMAVSGNPALIANPTVMYTSPNAIGTLNYQPAANVSGSASITVTVRDDSGTVNGGIDVIEHVFTISVTPVNDAPSFTAGANQTVTAQAGPQTVAGWASGFTPGPADEASQTLLGYTVVSNSNSALFTAAPVVAADGTLTYTPKLGAGGTATIGVTVQDSGGTANGGVDMSAVKTFVITISSNFRISLPLMIRSGAPDLVVTSIGLSPSKASFSAGEPVELAVVVENRGDQAAGPFWVDLSINPDHPPTTANQPWNEHCALTPCFGLAWYVQGLAPGARVTLTAAQLATGYAIWPGWLAAGTTDLYAYADTYNPGVPDGAVDESNETNNQFHLGGLTVTGKNPALLGHPAVADMRLRPVRFR